jgi:hypothetical protein
MGFIVAVLLGLAVAICSPVLEELFVRIFE